VRLVNAAFVAKMRSTDAGRISRRAHPAIPGGAALNPLLTILAANSAYLGGVIPGNGGRRLAMSISDFPVLTALRTKMQWHQERQRVLSENVANSDMPNFKPRDLVEPKFDSKGAAVGGAGGSLAMLRTSAAHIAPPGAATVLRRITTAFSKPGPPATPSISRTRCSRSPPTRWTMRR